MECKIPGERRMYERKPLVHCLPRWVIGLHATVQPEYKESEIKSQAKAVRHGNLFIECIKPEFAVRLLGIFLYCPDITGIDKGRTIEFPEQLGAILNACTQFYVT